VVRLDQATQAMSVRFVIVARACSTVITCGIGNRGLRVRDPGLADPQPVAW